jgi:hypothetical protein
MEVKTTPSRFNCCLFAPGRKPATDAEKTSVFVVA